MSRMIARHSRDPIDDFPTPPWATRALLRYSPYEISGLVWEPACGRRHMSKVLATKIKTVVMSTDKHRYTPDTVVHDFILDPPTALLNDDTPPQWVITNPPYTLAVEFWRRGMEVATNGVALLTRIGWLQNGPRHLEIFGPHPPQILFFAGRIPGAQGRVIQGPTGYFQHCWLIWDKYWKPRAPIWIPESTQEELERPEDYL